MEAAQLAPIGGLPVGGLNRTSLQGAGRERAAADQALDLLSGLAHQFGVTCRTGKVADGLEQIMLVPHMRGLLVAQLSKSLLNAVHVVSWILRSRRRVACSAETPSSNWRVSQP